jgi:hypothetical protein
MPGILGGLGSVEPSPFPTRDESDE